MILIGSSRSLSNGEVGEFYVVSPEGKVVERSRWDFAYGRGSDGPFRVMANGYRVATDRRPKTDPKTEVAHHLRFWNCGVFGRTGLSEFSRPEELAALYEAIIENVRPGDPRYWREKGLEKAIEQYNLRKGAPCL